MRALLYKVLILLAIIGLILMPPVLTGYAELRRAEVAMSSENYIQAGQGYERAALLLPWRTDLWEKAGFAATQSFGDYIRFFEIARKHSSLSVDGWEMLGRGYWILGDYDMAIVIWEKAISKYGANKKIYADLFWMYKIKGDFSKTLNVLETLAKIDSRDVFHVYQLGLYLSISNPDRALGEFLLASSLDPEYDPAVETIRAALNLVLLETDESSKLVIIGRGLGLVNEWSLASEAFRQAAAANGKNAEAWAWLGEANQQLGQDGSAELDKALSLDRTNPIVRSLRGVYWMRQDRADQALAEYLLAAEYDPDNPAWRISVGEAYALRGDLQAALASYLRATEMAPTDATVWSALAAFSAQYNMQLEDVGLPAAQMAVELSGEDPLSLDLLGWTLALLERYDEARDTLEHALSLDPQLPQGHLHLGIVTLQTDDWQAAKEHFRQAHDLDPDGPVGEQAQMLLNQYFP
ncbi:MAG: tetratricopeptide repeat protein [Chloroflexi bacterium]|nr:tetratricopeptide repeat protein [Chloroflexota bacterium]